MRRPLRPPPPGPGPSMGQACARTEASVGSITGSQHSQHAKRRGMLIFQRFRLQHSYNNYDHPNIEEISQFIAGLSWQGYASSTISTYVSGIAFIIKSNGLFDIPNNFGIRRLVAGCRRRHARRDTRCPITLPKLKAFLASLPHVCLHGYFVAMFPSAYCLVPPPPPAFSGR